MRVSLIGGTGALGGLLTRSLRTVGDDVTVWGRSGSDPLDVTDTRMDPRPLESDCIVYLAWATTDRSTRAQASHVAAAERWARAASLAGCRFLFMSTVVADPGSRSTYGRMKALAERRLRDLGARSLRVGLVVDDGCAGLLATRLRHLAERVPAVGRLAAWQVHPVSGADLVAACRAEATSSGSDGRPAWVAPDHAMPLAEVLAPGTSRRTLRWASDGIDAVARFIPPVPGPIGRYGDALRGLVPVPRDPESTRPPASGRIDADGWVVGTRPFRD